MVWFLCLYFDVGFHLYWKVWNFKIHLFKNTQEWIIHVCCNAISDPLLTPAGQEKTLSFRDIQKKLSKNPACMDLLLPRASLLGMEHPCVLAGTNKTFQNHLNLKNYIWNEILDFSPNILKKWMNVKKIQDYVPQKKDLGTKIWDWRNLLELFFQQLQLVISAKTNVQKK